MLDLNNFRVEKTKKILIIIGFIALVILVVVISLVGYKKFLATSQDQVRKNTTNVSIVKSIITNDPKELQGALIEDLKNGKNDKYTKSAAYFITHRYFDNGGDIYEIYDYVQSHPELAFLNEAEKIYPKIFLQIKNKELKAPDYWYYENGMYANLAYMEVLVNHGYADIATVSTIANQYAKKAYFLQEALNEMSKERAKTLNKRISWYIVHNKKKANKFIKIARKDVSGILNGSSTDDITSRDVLVGFNQTGATLRYLDALAIISATSTKPKQKNKKETEKIFAFSADYCRKNVQELCLFTSLLDASTLAIIPNASSTEIKAALGPLLALDVKQNPKANFGVVAKVIDSKSEIRFDDFYESANQDIYGKRNTIRLAKKVPEFKVWLISNGWKESDFVGWDSKDFK